MIKEGLDSNQTVLPMNNIGIKCKKTKLSKFGIKIRLQIRI